MGRWETLEHALQRLELATAPHKDAGFLGADPDPRESRIVLIPVPWDATVSYGEGTARGPAAIVAASHQLDLEDSCFQEPYRVGMCMLPAAPAITGLTKPARDRAARVIEGMGSERQRAEDLDFVNQASHAVNQSVQEQAVEYLSPERLVGVVGGDHSSPYGLIAALVAAHPDGFGILHIDAHLDLRRAYEGFTCSHASIMDNVTQLFGQRLGFSLVQVGIRDFSREEADRARSLGGTSAVFFAHDLFSRQARGIPWCDTVRDIIKALPPKVYVSFDIDGLEATYCPSTGTPVPGGLSFAEAMYLMDELGQSGRKIVGFDLCEVAPSAASEWDANVGARVLYKICSVAAGSQGWCRVRSGV